MSKIYTKTGDKGMSSLYDGRRISKADMRFEALGDIDELNASLGVSLRELIELSYKVYRIGDMKKYYNIWQLNEEIKEIQKSLFDIGASVATTRNDEKLNKVKFDENKILILEQLIDNWTDELEPLRNFILPNDNLQVTRAICRRAERHIVHLLTTPPFDNIQTVIASSPVTPTKTISQSRPVTKSSNDKETISSTDTQPQPINNIQMVTPVTATKTRPVTESLTDKKTISLTGTQPPPINNTHTVVDSPTVTATETMSQTGQVDPNVVVYINRLSDYLFTIARVKAELFEEKALCIWTI